jgi:hypothetical protein
MIKGEFFSWCCFFVYTLGFDTTLKFLSLMKRYFYAVLIAAMAGCSSSSNPIDTELSNTGKPALHAVQSAKLKLAMQQLNDLMFERMLNEVQVDRMRRGYVQDIVVVTDQLLGTLDSLPGTMGGLSLDDKEQQIFLSLVGKLKDQVVSLKSDAQLNHVDVIPQRAKQIVETCNSCHHLFRQR